MDTKQTQIIYSTNTSSANSILVHLRECDVSFIPLLSTRVDLAQYSEKLSLHAHRYEAWHEKQLVGLIAVYLKNGSPASIFISNVSVHPNFSRQGIASELLKNVIASAPAGIETEIQLEVNEKNHGAIKFYSQFGFTRSASKMDSVILSLKITT